MDKTSLHRGRVWGQRFPKISGQWSGLLDLVQRDSQGATGDRGDVQFGHFSLESPGH